ncbi:hypothetical protein BBJ28_00020557 [Nothophytophthora sp. Chile5]|nr:hypothetical protein BBJ28_00020557 [Nothophytophthora sp. Chile5]
MNAAKLSLQQLPLVDVSPLVSADKHAVAPEQKAQILADMRTACLETGFFTVPTKGVLSSQLIEAAYTRADEFLALPEAVKLQYHCKRTPNARGWTPMFEEPSPDVVSHLEGFDLARELPATYIQEGSSLGPNIWPAEVPRFQEDVYALYEETTKLSHVLFRSFAEMFDLPPETFLVRISCVFSMPRHCASHCTKRGYCCAKQQHVSEEAEAFMRLLTYPETHVAVKNSTVGIASHTDFECFTIIHQNGEGLHLLNRQGNWIEAPVCDDRYGTEAVHRVCNSEKKRQSIVRFNGADGDTVVAPLPTFVSAENPPRYASMTQREHITHQIDLAEQLLQQTKAAQAS